MSIGNDMSAFNGTSGHGAYDEPNVNVLRQSHRQNLSNALQQSASRGQPVDAYQSNSEDNGVMNPNDLLVRENVQWMERRGKLDRAVASAPKLMLTIQSSATLIKGEVIEINALGLVSHESKRAFPKSAEQPDANNANNG